MSMQTRRTNRTDLAWAMLAGTVGAGALWLAGCPEQAELAYVRAGLAFASGRGRCAPRLRRAWS